MNILSRCIFRALCAMLIGFLLVSNPEQMTGIIVQVIGGLFAASGLVSIIGYYVDRYRLRRAERRAQAQGITLVSVGSLSSATPIVALGSMAFGVVLAAFPLQFINALMYVLGGLLVLAGIGQSLNLIRFRSVAPLSWSLFVLPTLLVGTGAYMIARPLASASLPFIILGVAFIFYGVSEFCIGLRYHHFRRIYDRAMAEAEEGTFVEAEEIVDGDAPLSE